MVVTQDKKFTPVLIMLESKEELRSVINALSFLTSRVEPNSIVEKLEKQLMKIECDNGK